jgi:hypothetical protein
MEAIRWIKFFPPEQQALIFPIHVTPDELLSLDDLKGKPVIMGVLSRRLDTRL